MDKLMDMSTWGAQCKGNIHICSCSCARIVLQESVFIKFLDEFRLRGQGGGENSEILSTCRLRSYFNI